MNFKILVFLALVATVSYASDDLFLIERYLQTNSFFTVPTTACSADSACTASGACCATVSKNGVAHATKQCIPTDLHGQNISLSAGTANYTFTCGTAPALTACQIAATCNATLGLNCCKRDYSFNG